MPPKNKKIATEIESLPDNLDEINNLEDDNASGDEINLDDEIIIDGDIGGPGDDEGDDDEGDDDEGDDDEGDDDGINVGNERGIGIGIGISSRIGKGIDTRRDIETGNGLDDLMPDNFGTAYDLLDEDFVLSDEFIFDGSTDQGDRLDPTRPNSRGVHSSGIDDAEFYSNVVTVPRYTSKYLTRFEKIRAISERASMLSNGAPSTLPNSVISECTSLEIANLELQNKKLPFIIQRKLPTGITENISINDLIDIIRS